MWLLAVPRLVGGAGADVAHSRPVFDVLLDTTASPEPLLHDIAGLDGRRRIVARRVCMLAAHTRENGRLVISACAGDGAAPAIVDVVVVVVMNIVAREALAGVSPSASFPSGS